MNQDFWMHAFVGNKKKRRRRKRGGKKNRHVSNVPNFYANSLYPQVIPQPLKQPVATFVEPEFHPDRVLALDCEMVGVGKDGLRSIVARVSLVDWHGNVVMDTFVQPTEPVTNYRTFVSGVRPDDILSHHAMEFQACRALVHRLLHNKILVGHGLNNDLEVLRLTHPWFLIRDSATYEPFLKPGQRPKRLKELAGELLGVDIQLEGKQHCPIEDARAAMELYKSVRHEWDHSISWKRFVVQSPLRQLSM